MSALGVPCVICGAAAGEPCTDAVITKRPLDTPAVHPSRAKRAGAAVGAAYAAPPPQGLSAGPSALIGADGWHPCHIDAAGHTLWVDPVARPTAADALAAAQSKWATGGAR